MKLSKYLKIMLCGPMMLMLGAVGGGEGAPAAAGNTTSPDDSNSTTGTGEGTPPAGQTGQGDGQGQPAQKTFSQDDLSRIAAREKEEGRKAILKELGIEDTPDARAAIKSYLAEQEGKKSEVQKAIDRAVKAEKLAQENTQTAQALQMKLDAISEGADPAHVDDLIVLAKTKVTDKKDFKAVLKDMKSGEYAATFFGTGSQAGTTGTGSSTNHQRQQNNGQSFGARLAQQRTAPTTATKENPFFKH